MDCACKERETVIGGFSSETEAAIGWFKGERDLLLEDKLTCEILTGGLCLQRERSCHWWVQGKQRLPLADFKRRKTCYQRTNLLAKYWQVDCACKESEAVIGGFKGNRGCHWLIQRKRDLLLANKLTCEILTGGLCLQWEKWCYWWINMEKKLSLVDFTRKLLYY